jgi:protein-S-isoprenylcysteine O-methyltransferase Ste14
MILEGSHAAMWIMLAIPLLTRNPDGLLVFPIYFLLLWVKTMVEEKSDMRRRLPEAYTRHSEATRRFGPLWVWGVLGLVLGAIATVGFVTSSIR